MELIKTEEGKGRLLAAQQPQESHSKFSLTDTETRSMLWNQKATLSQV